MLWLPRAGLGLALLLAAVFVLWRHDIVKQWPSFQPIYEALGLLSLPPGEGLALKNVHSELTFESGMMRLSVTGEIVNQTAKTANVPDLIAAAIGPESDVMQSWRIDAPAATVAPSGTVAFHSSINAPKGTVVNINLNFAERKE